MKTPYISVDGEQNGVNFDAHYQVKGFRGIAFNLLGWLAEAVPVMSIGLDDEGNEFEFETGETELESNTDSVVAVMVGDDHRYIINTADLIPLNEDEFCHSCGQVGCGHNVYG